MEQRQDKFLHADLIVIRNNLQTWKPLLKIVSTREDLITRQRRTVASELCFQFIDTLLLIQDYVRAYHRTERLPFLEGLTGFVALSQVPRHRVELGAEVYTLLIPASPRLGMSFDRASDRLGDVAVTGTAVVTHGVSPVSIAS